MLLNTLPLEDIKESLIALAYNEEEMENWIDIVLYGIAREEN